MAFLDFLRCATPPCPIEVAAKAEAVAVSEMKRVRAEKLDEVRSEKPESAAAALDAVWPK